MLARLLLIAVASTALGGCGSNTVETSKCYFAGPPSVPEGAKTGPSLPCLPKSDARLPALLGDDCQKVVEVTSEPTQRAAAGSLPPSCCYEVEAEKKTCEVGRPLLVAGIARSARLASGSGWSS